MADFQDRNGHASSGSRKEARREEEDEGKGSEEIGREKQKERPVNEREQRNTTLFFAAQEGDEQTVQILLEEGKTNVDLADQVLLLILSFSFSSFFIFFIFLIFLIFLM